MPATPPPDFRVLLHRDDLLRRTRELAGQIGRDFGDEPPMLVAVIEGARVFARHLQGHLPGQLLIHEIRASSYGDGTVSRGEVEVRAAPDLDVRGQRLLLIEDIVDTGRTVAALQAYFEAAGAASCRVATLLTKPSRRVVDVTLDYVGFEIPDEFVVGFGMDAAGRFRELPDVVLYETERERAAR